MINNFTFIINQKIIMQKSFSENEQIITKLIGEIGPRYDYKIQKLDVFLVPRNVFNYISDVSADRERNLSIGIYLTEGMSVENVIVEIGRKIARQYFYDDPASSHSIKRAQVFGGLTRKILDWDSKRDFKKRGKDIIERSRLC